MGSRLRARALPVLLLLAAAAPLRGALIVADGTICTLADAIRAANADAPAGGCAPGSGPDVVDLRYDVLLTAPDPQSSSLLGAPAGLPDVVSPLVVQASPTRRIERWAGLGCSAASDGSDFRLFNVTGPAGELWLLGVTLVGGCVVTPPLALPGGGGAVASDAGEVVLGGAALLDNAVYGAAGASAEGGALLVTSAPVTIGATLFDGNLVAGGSGGGAAFGGAGALRAGASLAGTTATRNVAQAGSGGGGNGGEARGGAFFVAGPLAATSTTVSGNRAAAGAGSSGGTGAGGGLDVVASGAAAGATLSRLLVRGNVVSGGTQGSGLGNSGAGYCGGLDLEVPGSITGSWVEGNLAVGGGGISSTGDAAGGGACTVGTTTITTSTFSQNVAAGGSGRGSGGNGQGGGLSVGGTGTTLRNVTLVGNSARGGNAQGGGWGFGGGLAIGDSATASLVASTVVQNDARSGTGGSSGAAWGGGVSVGGSGTLTVADALLAGNLIDGASTGADCYALGATLDTTQGSAVEHLDASCSSAGWSILLAKYGLPADHGCAASLPDGSCPPTSKIAPGSVTVDAGSCLGGALVDDQRGYPRPVGAGCDFGAYEVSAPADVDTAIAGPATAAVGAGASPVQLELRLTNTGSVTVTGLDSTIAIGLPPGVALVGGSSAWPGSVVTCDSTSCSWTGVALPAGASATADVLLDVGAAVDGTTFSWSATLDAATPAVPAVGVTRSARVVLLRSALFASGFEPAAWPWSWTSP